MRLEAYKPRRFNVSRLCRDTGRSMTDRVPEFRHSRAYTIREAANLARTHPQNIRNWLLGFDYEYRTMQPVFGSERNPSGELMLTFLELAEVIMVARFREPRYPDSSRRRVTLAKVRTAHSTARAMWPEIRYPFASLKLKEFGGEIMHRVDVENPAGGTLALSRRRQWALPELVMSELNHFDFESLLASRWFPAGRDKPIVVDPELAAGRMTIRGTRVTLDIIHKRFFNAKQDIAFIARDLFLQEPDVEEAIKYARAA